jgi:DNA-binding transcriptional LysR family regulator
LTFTLREGYQPQIEAWLEKQEIDLAMTLLGPNLPPLFNNQPMLRLPLILIVPKKSPIKSADELWKRDKITEALITLPAYESVCRNFQQGLARKGLDWLPSIEVSSLKLIEIYVASGYGIGLFLDIPNNRLAPELRSLPLPDFEPVTFGALWRGKITPLIQAFMDETVARARELLGPNSSALASQLPPPRNNKGANQCPSPKDQGPRNNQPAKSGVSLSPRERAPRVRGQRTYRRIPSPTNR